MSAVLVRAHIHQNFLATIMAQRSKGRWSWQQQNRLCAVIRWFSCLFIWVPLLASGQKRNYNWVFGEHMWMDFANDTMVFVPVADTIADHNAAIKRTLGSLVLVADEHGIRSGDPGPDRGGCPPSWDGRRIPASSSSFRHPDTRTLFRVHHYGGGHQTSPVRWRWTGLAGGQSAVMGTTSWFAQGNVTTKLAATTPMRTAPIGWYCTGWVRMKGFLAYALSADGRWTHHLRTDLPFLPPSVRPTQPGFLGRMTFSFKGDRWRFPPGHHIGHPARIRLRFQRRNRTRSRMN